MRDRTADKWYIVLCFPVFVRFILAMIAEDFIQIIDGKKMNILQ